MADLAQDPNHNIQLQTKELQKLDEARERAWHVERAAAQPIRLILLVAGLLLSIGLLLILPWKCLSILIFGQMVAERISLLLMFLKLLVLVFI